MTTTRLIIARHGNTFAPHEEVRRVGKTDLPLVASGLAQGQALGRYLQSQQLVPEVIFTSTLQRTQQTAAAAQAAMHSQLPVQPLALFDEIDYGVDENQPEAAVVARLGLAALQAWDEAGVVPNGWQASPASLIKNWQDFAGDLRQNYPGKTVLVVTSNGIARFAPHLTGDFARFRTQHGIKLATGAIALFENHPRETVWHATAWNVKPPL